MIESISIDPRIKIRVAKDLLLVPKVLVVQAFDEEEARNFRRDMSLAHRTGQSIIPVVIDSFGGDVYALLSMVDTIRSAKVPIATIIQGKAMSCGAVLFTCGTEGYRFMAPNATLMVHDVASWEASKKAEEVMVDARETNRLNKKIYRIMDKNCRQKPGFFWNLVQDRSRVDWYIAPREAVRLNLANHIKIPTMRTVVKVDCQLDF
jgi:ATP-dependent Clp endopeptidase proteolytic subunit ClpP